MALIPPPAKEAFEKGGQDDVLMQAAPSQATERSMLETNRDAIMAKTSSEDTIIKAQGSRGKVRSGLFSQAYARLEEKRRRRGLDALFSVHTMDKEAIMRAHHESFRNFDPRAYMQSQAKNDQLNNMMPKTKAKDNIIKARVRSKFFTKAKLEEDRRRGIYAFCGVQHTIDKEEAIRRARHESIRNFDPRAYMQSQAKNDQLGNMKLKAKAEDTIIKAQETSLLIGNSYCKCAAGIEAAEAATDLMRSNIALKEITDDKPAPPVEDKKLATWGTDVVDDLVLDQKCLTQALKKIQISKSNSSGSNTDKTVDSCKQVQNTVLSSLPIKQETDW